ncbi:MAG: DUF4214 domain-containing protein [Candidatus Obscuribacterales bacterium]|nr:DUF4214 domain-containing protein [Candidatus Obscuribacterales bacterium]
MQDNCFSDVVDWETDGNDEPEDDDELYSLADEAIAEAEARDNVCNTNAQSNESDEKEAALEDSAAAPDAMGITGVLDRLTQLPEKLSVQVEKQSVKLSADDFMKLVKFIPGFPESKDNDFSKVKSITLDGNSLKIEGKATIGIPNPLDAKSTLPLKLENFSAELQVDPKDPTKLILGNITGMKIALPGIDLNLQEITLSVKSENGKKVVYVEVSKHNAVAPPSPLQALVAAQVTKLNETKFGQLALPLDSEAAVESVQKVVEKLQNWTATEVGKKDTKRMANDVVIALTGNDVSRFIPDVQAIDKKGDRLELQFRDKPVNLIAGVPIVAEKTVTATVSTRDNKLVLSNIQGAKFALPADIAAMTGRTDTNLDIEEISLSEPDKDGNRMASVRLRGFIESVKINAKVGADMRPVPIDAVGNISVRLEMKMGEKVSADIQFNPDGADGKVKALYKTLLNREPDYPGCMWAVDKFNAGARYKDVALALINNDAKEFRNSIPKNKADIVPFLYQRLLGREPESKDAWLKVLETEGVDAVIRGIFASEEFKKKHPDYLVNVSITDGAGDVSAFLEKLNGQPVHQSVKDLLKDSKSLSVNADHSIVFKSAGPRTLGDLPIEAEGQISFKVERTNVEGELRITNASGIKAKLPVPDDLLAKLGCPKDVPFKGVQITPVGDNGNQVVRVEFDHPQIQYAGFVVDKQGKTVVENGRISARIHLKLDDKVVECIVEMPADQKPGAFTHVHLKGDASAKVATLKRLGAPPEIAEVAGEVKVVSVSNDTVGLHFDNEINANINGLNMKFDKTVAIKVLPPRQVPLGWPAVNHDYREVAVSGIQVTGFDFRGNQWKEVGSKMLNTVLSQQNDLPIKVSGLYFASAPNVAQIRVGVFASEGGLQSAHFTLESKENPNFVDGTVRVKNPFRGIGIIRNDDQVITVRLNQDGVQKPVATARDVARPILDDPILKWTPPVRAVRTAVAVGEFLEDNGLLPWQW